jgi:hypothetical protein
MTASVRRSAWPSEPAIIVIRMLVVFLCLAAPLSAEISPDVFLSARGNSLLRLGLTRHEIGSSYYLFALRHANSRAYFGFRGPNSEEYAYLKYANYQALELDLEFDVFLPAGLLLSSYLPFFTIKDLPLPVFASGERSESVTTAEEGLRLGDVRFRLCLERSLGRYFSRISLGLKLPTGDDPYELSEPLMATGTGSQDLLLGASAGVGLWIFTFASGVNWEDHGKLQRNSYLYLRDTPQEIDPGDVLIGSLGVRTNFFRDSHQDVFLSTVYYYRSQGAERTAERQWDEAWETHYLKNELNLLFHEELEISASVNCYGIWYTDGVFGYQGLDWALSVSLLIGGSSADYDPGVPIEQQRVVPAQDPLPMEKDY